VASHYISKSIRNDFGPHAFWCEYNCFLLAVILMHRIPPSEKHQQLLNVQTLLLVGMPVFFDGLAKFILLLF
jgi:hypothetical protein